MMRMSWSHIHTLEDSCDAFLYKKKTASPPTATKEAGTMFGTAAPEEVAAAAELPEVDEASSEVEAPVAEADEPEPDLVLVAVLEAEEVFVSASTPGHFIMQARIVLKASEPGIISLG